EERAPEDLVELQCAAATDATRNGGQRVHVVVDQVGAGQAEHPPVGLGLVGETLLTDLGVLQFPVGTNLLVLEAARQSVAGDRLEVLPAARGGDPLPG